MEVKEKAVRGKVIAVNVTAIVLMVSNANASAYVRRATVKAKEIVTNIAVAAVVAVMVRRTANAIVGKTEESQERTKRKKVMTAKRVMTATQMTHRHNRPCNSFRDANYKVESFKFNVFSGIDKEETEGAPELLFITKTQKMESRV